LTIVGFHGVPAAGIFYYKSLHYNINLKMEK